MSPRSKRLSFTLIIALFLIFATTHTKSIRGPTSVKCTERSDICTREYNPVCAHKPDIVCITIPCNYITYSNPCEACKDSDVESYIFGSCENPHPTQVLIVPVEQEVSEATNTAYVTSIEFENELKKVSQPIITKCSSESREGDICPAVYMPVCAYKPDIVCVTTPCNYVTYGSPCEACHDLDVESYTYGECPEEEKPIIECFMPEPQGIMKCSLDSREGDICPAVYMPVCAYKPDIVCVTTPCNYVTYGNPCEACQDLDVASYTYGECFEEESKPKSVPKVSKCTPESREIDGCYEVYEPVCGYKPNIVCITTPCNYITYGNACEACINPDVESYTQGECVDEAKKGLL